MIRTAQVVALSLLVALPAFAAEPSAAGRRHREVEEALVAHEQKRTASNVVIAAGAASLVVAAVSAVTGAGIEANNIGKTVATVGVAPYAAIAGAPVPKAPELEDATPAFTTALVTGLVGVVALGTGLVVREAVASKATKRELLEEKTSLAIRMRQEEAAALEASREALRAPSLLPSTVPSETPVPVEPSPTPRRPLRPATAVDAPLSE